MILFICINYTTSLFKPEDIKISFGLISSSRGFTATINHCSHREISLKRIL